MNRQRVLCFSYFHTFITFVTSSVGHFINVMWQLKCGDLYNWRYLHTYPSLQTCEDFMINCRFAGRVYPCMEPNKQLTWTTTTSHYGTCCSFNYNPLTDEFQPFASNTFGYEGGLTVVGTGAPSSGRGLSGNLFSSGLVVSLTFMLIRKDSLYLWIWILKWNKILDLNWQGLNN